MDKQLVLPLHQRLRLMKKGEQLSFYGGGEAADCAVGMEQVGQLVSAGVCVPVRTVQRASDCAQRARGRMGIAVGYEDRHRERMVGHTK